MSFKRRKSAANYRKQKTLGSSGKARRMIVYW